MARISSLNVLLTDSGKDFLAEQYGKVIANIQKNPISSQLKNTDLSGSPTSGTVEAKRFVNATSQAYGTARSGGKANAVKAKPIVIPIDHDEEILEEVEHKDVSLYGVDNFVERRAAECERKMTNKLEHAFFDTAAKAGTQVTPVGTTPEAIAEELIQSVETVSNDFVDGVERNMIALVCNPAFYGNGWVYRPFTADEALLEPSVEIGDTVQINGWKSIVAKLDRSFDKMFDASVSAPDDEELNHEYPYVYTGYRGNHELKQVEQEIAKVSSDVDNISSDLNDFKASVASMSSKRTVKLNFSNFSSGSFTETLENSTDPTITYDVAFDSSGRPIKLTCSDGHTLDITW